VAGVAFIGISVALHVSPFLRSAMIALGAGVLIGLAQYLKPRPTWAPLSQWLMSSGAAVFLFACFGSGALPALRWIENPWGALGILLVGIAANLSLAWSVASQTFASLHVVLSLIPLAIIPQSRMSIILAAIVTLAAVGLSFRSRWDRHLMVTLVAYAVFHAQWYMETGILIGEETGLRLTGLACALLVGIAAGLVHYRQDYRRETLEKLPFIVHLTNWGMMGMAGLAYSQRTPLRGVALMLGSVVAFLLARHGRKVGVRWVYLTDTLMAQGLAAMGILSFYPYVFDRTLLLALLFAETALFLRIVVDAGEDLLKRIGLFSLHGSALVLCVPGFMAMEPGGIGGNLGRALLLLASAAIGAALHVYFLRARGEEFDSLAAYGPPFPTTKTPTSILGVLTGLLLMVALLNVRDRLWMEIAALASIGLAIFLARRVGSRGLAVGSWLAMGLVHLVNWAWISGGEAAGGTGEQLTRLVPLLALSILAIRYTPTGPFQSFLRHAAIYVLCLHVFIGAYFMLWMEIAALASIGLAILLVF
jgi:hypothetical protein